MQSDHDHHPTASCVQHYERPKAQPWRIRRLSMSRQRCLLKDRQGPEGDYATESPINAPLKDACAPLLLPYHPLVLRYSALVEP
jgi:hypothetical protein